MTDQTQDFLESLPEIKKDETFWFACHPQVTCFNACCGDLTMPLTPYDVLRLCRGLELGSEAFIDTYARVSCYPDSGFPILHLLMEEDMPDKPCPFVTEQGCGVYEHRSSACRTYPLGRATKPAKGGGIEEQYFLVREDHCQGFSEKKGWTIAEWIKNQGLTPYNAMNDRFSRLMARYKEVANEAVLSEKHATMALLCLYQQDQFKAFMEKTGLLDHVDFIGEWETIPRDELVTRLKDNAEDRLCFGIAWMELILFGQCDLLAPRAK